MCTITKKPCGHNEVIAKPDPCFFAQLIAKNPNTKIIFIDDKKQNICAAQQLGIDGILFEKAEQLKKELAKRGITINNQHHSLPHTIPYHN